MVLALGRVKESGCIYACAAWRRYVREQLGQAHVVVLQSVVLGGLELVVDEQVQGTGSCYKRPWLARRPC